MEYHYHLICSKPRGNTASNSTHMKTITFAAEDPQTRTDRIQEATKAYSSVVETPCANSKCKIDAN